jgi:hypothetical protein
MSLSVLAVLIGGYFLFDLRSRIEPRAADLVAIIEVG